MVRMARTSRADPRAGGPELPKISQAALERKRLRRGPAVPGRGEDGLRGNDGFVGFARLPIASPAMRPPGALWRARRLRQKSPLLPPPCELRCQDRLQEWTRDPSET